MPNYPSLIGASSYVCKDQQIIISYIPNTYKCNSASPRQKYRTAPHHQIHIYSLLKICKPKRPVVKIQMHSSHKYSCKWPCPLNTHKNSLYTQQSTSPQYNHNYPLHYKYANIEQYITFVPNTHIIPHYRHIHNPTFPNSQINSSIMKNTESHK